MNPIRFEIDLYGVDVVVFFNKDTFEQKILKKFLKESYKEYPDAKETLADGIHHFTKSFKTTIENAYGYKCSYAGVYMIVLKEFKPDDPWSHGVLAHEIHHVVDGILDSAGMSLTASSCEAYAYLTGHITEKIYKEILKDNGQSNTGEDQSSSS